jgi:hypothetical protein
MAKNFQDLFEFIDRAVKSRKYPENTARGLKASLKLFEPVLNEEELQSLDVFEKNLDQIYHSVTLKNGKNFNASSLAVYKSRIIKIINDYKKYGLDPTKMASWTPKTITRSSRKKDSSSSPSTDDLPETSPSPISTNEMHKIELSLRPDSNKKFIIIVPRDITLVENSTIKAILDSLTLKPENQ